MRRAARVDDNQSEIVATFRRLGASVAILSGVGQGVPDILIGYRGRDALVEIKDGAKPPSKRRLTKDEAEFHQKWTGRPVEIVETVEQAVSLIAAMGNGA